MTRAHIRLTWVVFSMHLKQMAVDSFVIFAVIVQPLLVALLAMYILRGTAGFQAVYVIVGSALTGLWTGTLFLNAQSVEAERWSGSLESIIGSPTSLSIVMLGKALANTTMSVSSMLLSYPLAALLFGFQLTIAQPLLFVVSALLTVLGFVSLGLLIAPLVSITPGSDVWCNPLEFPMYIVGGFLFPVALLPAWTTPISYVLSPYWAARALHAASSGGLPADQVLAAWGSLIGCSVAYWVISAWLFRVLLRHARAKATLGLQ